MTSKGSKSLAFVRRVRNPGRKTNTTTARESRSATVANFRRDQPEQAYSPIDTPLLDRRRRQLVSFIKRLCSHALKGIQGVRSSGRVKQVVVKRVSDVVCHPEKTLWEHYTEASRKATDPIEGINEILQRQPVALLTTGRSA